MLDHQKKKKLRTNTAVMRPIIGNAPIYCQHGVLMHPPPNSNAVIQICYESPI